MLVQNCYTDEDRHQFVTGSLTTGPNVFVDGLSDTAKSDAGPHHRWGTGALWDNITVNGNALDIQNRGNLGSGHGWAGANEVAYNCYASSGYVVQKPPGAHNWLIGSIGSIKNGTVYVGPHDPGDFDSGGTIYKLALNGTVLGTFGKVGKLVKEFGTTAALDCRTENDLWVGEIWNWRAQRVTLRR